MGLKEKLDEHRTAVCVLDNKLLAKRSVLTNTREKMKGRFRLRMSPHLSSPQKIEKYAQEPLAFHLYKNRHFMNKISITKNYPNKSTTQILPRNLSPKQSTKIRKIRAKFSSVTKNKKI
jgi:hypothetical protein